MFILTANKPDTNPPTIAVCPACDRVHCPHCNQPCGRFFVKVTGCESCGRAFR